MKKSNLKKPLITSIVVVVIAIITLSCVYLNSTKMNKYLVINENLYIDNIGFEKTQEELHAIHLGKLLGKTDEGQQVYEIEGLNPKEWICVRNEGKELIYQKIEIYNHIGITDLNIGKIDIKEKDVLSGIKNSIVDEEVINQVISSMSDENLVNSTIVASQIKELVLYSNAYPGLSYSIYIIHDETNGYFLYDINEDSVWTIDIKELEQYL